MFRIEGFMYFIAALVAVAVLIVLMTACFYAAPFAFLSGFTVIFGFVLATIVIYPALRKQWIDSTDTRTDH